MALKLDNTLLEELGLGALPEQEKQLLLRQIYERLEMNVGMRLADQMSNEQLDAFEKFVEAKDDKGAFQWLETNFPNYKDVVNQEFEKLKVEISSVAPQILANAQQQTAAAPQMQSGQPMQQGYAQPQSAPPSAYGPAPQAQPQPQYQQPAPQPYQQPMPQPQYQQPAPQPHYAPPAPQPQPTYAAPAPVNPPQPVTAQPQAGHLQPQYGVPSSQPSQNNDATDQTQSLPTPEPPLPADDGAKTA